jgi:hypothetical protein
VCGVHRCRAHQWCRACRSNEEGHDKSSGEGRGGSARWRKSRRSGGAVEREEDRLSHLGAVEMLAGGAEARWRGRHGRERGRRGRVVERYRGATVR